ncbi:MAG TPA: hypothetical protein VFL57_13515, partial [Bryobacteraceae bacterium]|nr:hypothetical protein [Bryobacteraceae bacterium]
QRECTFWPLLRRRERFFLERGMRPRCAISGPRGSSFRAGNIISAFEAATAPRRLIPALFTGLRESSERALRSTWLVATSRGIDRIRNKIDQLPLGKVRFRIARIRSESAEPGLSGKIC